MSHAEKIINFNDHRPVVEADIDKGFDRLAGDLTDALALNEPGMSGREYQIVMAIVSKTYRYHKSSDWISHSQFEEITGIAKSNISKLTASLVEKRVLIRGDKKLRINKVVSEWRKVESNSSDKSNPTLSKKKSNPTKAKSNTTKKKSNPTPYEVESDPHNRKTIIQQTTTQKTKRFSPENADLPDFLPKQNWLEFVQHRKDIKKPLSELATTKLLNQIIKDHNNGLDVIAAMDASIANRWTGIFAKPSQGQSKQHGVFPTRKEQITQRNMQACQDFIGGEYE